MLRPLVILLTLFLSAGPAISQADKKNSSSHILDDLERELDSTSDDVDSFIVNNEREFYAYIDSLNNDFANYLAKEWKSVDKGKAVKYERDKEYKPIIYDEKKEQNREHRILKGSVIPILRQSSPQPSPVRPILENKAAVDYSTFAFYGTSMSVRWGNASKFKFNTNSLTNKDIANAYRKFSGKEYQNLLSDCLKLRKIYHLCDWAYYKLLETVAEKACGKGSNEAKFLHGTLYGKSGYSMRFAIDANTRKLYILCRIIGGAFDYTPYYIDGKIYYLFENSAPAKLSYCPKEYKGEQPMSLDIKELPHLSVSLDEEKTIRALSYPIAVKSQVNKNLVDFFDSYPTSYKDDNFMTRWAYYANTPVSDEMRENVYPDLKKAIYTMRKETAVNMLLSWVQPLHEKDFVKQPDKKGEQIGIHYGNDNDMWGHDRAFFAEETLHYDYSDCEDHAILFSHLVRDLLGLDVALVYYPGHLSTAICFGEEYVEGDAFDVNGRRFVVADPTYCRGKVGMTGSEARKANPKDIKLIVLER